MAVGIRVCNRRKVLEALIAGLEKVSVMAELGWVGMACRLPD